MLKHRDNIVIVKLATSKKVALPNGTTFYATYKRFCRNALPYNETIKRTYRKRRKNRQRGRGLGKILRSGFSLGKKLAKSRIEKELPKMAIKKCSRSLSKRCQQIKK